MKNKHLLLMLLLALMAPWAAQAQQCEISYNLTDSYGDGWNGGSMVVTDATTSTQLASLTISSGSSLVGTIPVTSGHEITFSYTAGSYAYENSWVFTDIAGTTIWEGSGDGGSQSYTYTAECPSCLPPSDITVTLTPGQGTIATFSWSSDATAWQICFNNDESNLFDVNRPSFTYNGFTPETQYTVKVRTNCDGQYSSWSSPVTFTPTSAYQITVNDGTSTNEYVPIYGYYVDSNTKSQFIIPANVLDNMAYGTITQLTFYASQSSINWGNATFEVYMSETAETTLSTLVDWSTMTKVRNAASLSIVNNMMVVVFDTPYEYQGGNLMIGFNQPTTGTYVRSNWYGVSATGASLGGYGSSVSQKNFLPKTTFNYLPAAASDCERPDDLLALDEPTAHEFSFSIEGGSGVYNIELKAGSDDWETYALGIEATTINLTNLESNTAYQVRVQSVCGDNTSGWKTLSFTTKNPCAVPTNLQVSDITASSATLSWTPGYQETEWTVKYKKSTDSEYTTETVNRNPTLTLRNLDGCTQYNVQIYNCESYLSGNFVTAAAIPLNETFATTSAPAGWTRYTGLLSDVMSGTALTTTTSGWSFNTGNGVFDNHARVNIYGTNCKYWLVAPTLTMENNVQLSFDLALTAYSGTLGAPATTGTDDKFVVLINDGNGWTILRQWDNAGSEYVYNNINCTAVGENVTIDLSSYAGQQIAIAFYGESTQSNADNNLHIDNVSINYIPDCASPTGLAKANVTAHTVDLSWTSDASGWVVAYKTAEDPEFREVNVTANSYTLTNLEPETAYTVKVKANCDGVYSDWSNPLSFTTGIACTAPTGLASSNITGHGATITWAEVEGALYQCAIAKTNEYDVNNIEWSESFEENTLTLNGLDPQTGYTFVLRKDCTGAEDGYSQIVTRTFTTAVACPAPTVAVSNITAYAAEVSCTNTDAEYFNVMLDTVVFAENVTMPYTLIDLEPNTSYTVKVQAICGGEDGESAYSNGTTFMTAEICPEGMVCIGTGTGTSTYMPINNYYNYSLSEQIYTAAEIGQAGAILSIEFFKAATIEAVKDLNIYMVATNKDEFASNTDWITVTASDLVYSGTVTFVDNDWTTIELDNPFIYDGTSNVCVVVDNNTGSYKSSTNFRTFNDVKNRTLYYQSDGTNPDPLDPTINASGKTATKNRIRLAIGEPPACPKPTGLAVNYINGITVTVTWEGDATSYNIDVNGTVTENVTSPYTLEGLELATTYNVMVQAVCSAEELSEWTAPVSFTTDLCMPENQCEISYSFTDAYNDSWNGAYISVVDVATEEILYDLTMPNVTGPYEGSFAVCDGRELQFVWHSGSYDSECSFVIKDLNDEVIVEGISSTLPVNYTVNCTVITCKKPTDLAAFDIDKKSVVLSWTPGTEDQNAWRIAYMSENDTIYSYKNVTANPYTLKGLTPETSYTVKVRANCGGGDYSNWSDEISFTTAEACPTEIFNLNVSNITVHNALVTWNGDYDHYQVRYKGGEMTDWSEELTTNSPSIALTGLTAETNYDYQVQGYCADADAFTDWVSGLGFATASICAAPDNLLVIPSITTANISWTGYLASYTVAWGEYSAEGITGNNFMMDNLQPSTTYTAIVTGEGCQEAISASIEFTTGAGWTDPDAWADEGVIADSVTVVVTGEDGEEGVINAGEIQVGDGSVIVIEDGAELIFTTEDDQPIPVIITFGDDDEEEDEEEGGGGKDDIIEYGKYRLIAPPTFITDPITNERYLPVDTTHLMDNYYENDLYSFDQSYPAAEWRNYKWTANNFVNFNWKQGYLYSYVTNTGVWPGNAVPTANATQNIDLVYDENANFIGANLVGNPFIVKAYPGMPFYVLNTAGTEILSKNVGTSVALGKGFFVIANQPGQTCAITTNAPEAKKALNITLSQGRGMIDAAFINFSEIENMRKFQLNPNHTKIYMPFEGKDYAVLQGEELGEMPINFEAEKNGTYTLSFESSEVEFSYLHLIDNLTGVETNLLKTPAYTFNANVSDYASRFRLVYATGSSISGNGSFGFVNEAGNLCIFGIEGEATLQVVDVTGRVLSSKQFSGSYESKLNVAPGVYMLRLINGNDVKVQKIVME